MQGHIVRVNVAGREVDDDVDLDDVDRFDVETLTGRSYTVQRTSSVRWRRWTWDVLVAASPDSGTDGDLGVVGTIKRTGCRWSGFAYVFRVPGHPMDGGSQSTLWNAVQSLSR
ncbi:hypothetical protein [Cellulomonas sp. P24]|uniref:hypothetical protein n=1 Tax=Cellulomonas sp. P24 TaxID=2885206 RepID=UPI00216B3BBD|nr:hypothetical protein [Cellulomonas sp. P24]MCR6493839.1 hypothetical protein [Cellulomonas sp. P24]